MTCFSSYAIAVRPPHVRLGSTAALWRQGILQCNMHYVAVQNRTSKCIIVQQSDRCGLYSRALGTLALIQRSILQSREERPRYWVNNMSADQLT